MMDKPEILEKVNSIFIDVLDNAQIKLNNNTTADDIEEWDSLNHIKLVVAVETFFKIRFSSKEVRHWKNVGEMCDSISNKIN